MALDIYIIEYERLARDESGALIDGERLSTLEADRPLLDKSDLTIGDFLKREKLRLACDLLQPYAHWVTPKMMPKPREIRSVSSAARARWPAYSANLSMFSGSPTTRSESP